MIRRRDACGAVLAALAALAAAVPAWPSPQHAMEGMQGMDTMPGMQHATSPKPAEPAPIDPNIPIVTLEDIERRALEHNPAIAAAEAEIRAADARRSQAGLWPNPVVGYSGDDIPLAKDRTGGQHGFFVAQDFPLGKLGPDRQVSARELEQARVGGEAQRLRLQAQVRMLFYRTLAAQQRVEVRERLAALAREAVEVTLQLFNTGSADGPDRLAVENEASLLDSSLASARIELDQLWASLRAMVNDPGLEPGRLKGDLAQGLPQLDREEWRRRLLAESPDLRLSAVRVARAEAVLARAKAARIPDLTFSGGIRRDRAEVQPGGPEIGNVGFADVGVRLPLWNRNQGGIAAAEAELAKSRLDQESSRLALEARFAAQFGRYRQAALRAATFRDGVLVRARSAYEQYRTQYGQMMAAYPQVLIAQRTLFQLEDEYIDTLDRAWESSVAIQTLQFGGEPGGMGMTGTTGAMGLGIGLPGAGGEVQP